MFRLITPEDYVTTLWKNGGGITHEIARSDQEGRLLWRLSVAEVDSDGPFSRFEGLSRILTVITGAGLALHTPAGRLDALPLTPLAFSGDLPVECVRLSGPVRDLNVIYDATRLTAHVEMRVGPFAQTFQGLTALYALADGVTADGVALPVGACAIGDGSLTLADGASGLLIRLS